MKLKLTVHNETVIDVDNVDELPNQLREKLEEEGESGVVGKEAEKAIEQAMKNIVSDDSFDGLIDLDETHLKVEVVEGDFDIGNAVEGD